MPNPTDAPGTPNDLYKDSDPHFIWRGILAVIVVGVLIIGAMAKLGALAGGGGSRKTTPTPTRRPVPASVERAYDPATANPSRPIVRPPVVLKKREIKVGPKDPTPVPPKAKDPQPPK